MKKLNVLTRMLLLVALLVGSTSSVWADYEKSIVYAEKVATASFTWTGSLGETWSGTVTGGAVNQNLNNGYAQIGTSKSPSTSIVVSTSGITEKIKRIVVNCAAYQGKAKLSATVGGAAFGTQNQDVPSWSSSTGGDISFTNLEGATGTIQITMTNGSGGQAMYIKSITVSYGTEIPSKPQVVGEGTTWDLSSASISANTSNTIKATDNTTEIIYVAGGSDKIKSGALQPGGKSTMTGDDAARYFILHITKSGILTLNSGSKFGEYLIYQGNTDDITDALQQASIITPTTDVPTSGNIDIANGEYVFIGFDTQIYTTTLNWNESATVTINTTANMAGWRAFYDATQGYTLDANTKAYISTETTASTVKLKEIDDVPAGTPVILHTSSSADNHKMTLTKAASTSDVPAGNLLAVTNGTSDVTNKYRLGYLAGDGNGIGFYPYSATKPAAGIVYLDVPSGDAKGLTFVFDDDETDGIKAVSTKVENGVRYNLAGQKVGADYKGIVIVNGKKMFNK